VRAFHEHFEIFLAYAPKEAMYFPSAGVVPLLLGTTRGWLLPMTPQFYVAAVERTELSRGTVLPPAIVSCISVGLVGDRVVLPPMRADADHALVVKYVQQCRADAKHLCELLLKMQQVLERNVGREESTP
jgi:hypothetical protein